jgi:hypothetical protein
VAFVWTTIRVIILLCISALLWHLASPSTLAATVASGTLLAACIIFPRPRSACLFGIKWLIGRDDSLPAPNDSSELGTAQGLSILAFILTQVVALTASQFGRIPLREAPIEYTLKFATLYFSITVVVLGSIVGLLRSTGDNGEAERTRTFDRGTLTFLRWSFSWALFLSLGGGAMAWYGLLPTQATTGKLALNDWTAEVNKIDPSSDAEIPRPAGFIGKPIVWVVVPLSARLFSEGLPQDMLVSINTQPELRKRGWRVMDADVFIGDPALKNKHTPEPVLSRAIRNPKRPPVDSFDMTIRKLQPGESYSILLVLWKVDASKEDAATFTAFLNQQKEKALDVKSSWTRF